MVKNVETNINMRDWLEAALVSKGALVTDSGFAENSVDIGFTVDGMPFHVTMTARKLDPIQRKRAADEKKRQNLLALNGDKAPPVRVHGRKR